MEMDGGDSENLSGICVILDHRANKDNQDKWVIKILFEKVFGYEIKEIDIPPDFIDKGVRKTILNQLENIAKNEVKETHRALILFVFGECNPIKISPDDYHETIISNSFHSDEYLGCFKGDNCEIMKAKPKILIQHMWHYSFPNPKDTDGDGRRICPVDSDPFPEVQGSGICFKDETILQVFSRVIDETDNFSSCQALFIQSMDRICRTFTGGNCDIVEILTKVLRDVEISQALTRKQETQNGGTTSIQNVAHNITFSCQLDSTFVLLPSGRFTASSTNQTHTENPQALQPDDLPSANSSFFLNPGQYKDLDTYSEFELDKLPSIKIELKEQKLKDDIKKQYPMDKNPRGYCLLINMSNDRLGSILDEMRMCQLFRELSFKTFLINNRSHEEIETEVKRLAKSIEPKKENVQCLFIILMAHGGLASEDDCYITADEKHFETEQEVANGDTGRCEKGVQTDVPKVYVFRDINKRLRSPSYIFKPFEGKDCPGLNAKPKICVLQTCFGDGKMEGCEWFIGDINEKEKERTSTAKGDDADGGHDSSSMLNVSVPHEKSDWYKLHATIEGYKAYRTTDTGSYVIDALDEKFRKHAARSDISQLMTMVTGAVSDKGRQKEGKWQQPECRTYFNGSLYLNPGFTKHEYLPLNISPTGSSGSNNCKVDVRKTFQGSVCWAAGDYVAVASNTSSNIDLYSLQVTDNHVESYQPDTDTRALLELKGIVSGMKLSVSENVHIIIYTKQDGTREIAAIALDDTTKTWKRSTNLTKTIANPLTICEINNDCFGVLRGTPNTDEDATIEVYTSASVLRFISETTGTTKLHDSVATPIQTELTIRVNYAEVKQSTINLRDQLCYSQTKFYILGFYKSIVHKVNIRGEIEATRDNFKSKPVAMMRGPDGAIDVACCDDVYVDVFGEPTAKADKAFPIEGYASHMMNVSGSAVIISDPGLNHSMFALIPQFQHKKVSLYIERKDMLSGLSQQCIWATNKPDVVAVGSAESTHLHLVSNNKAEPNTQGFFSPSELGYNAKIVQGIHIQDTTHLVMFDASTDKTKQMLTLKLVTMDTENKNIAVMKKSNTCTTGKVMILDDCLSTINPAAIFDIDAHTFGVVCKMNANVDIMVFEKAKRCLAKRVQLQQPNAGGKLQHPCVGGQFKQPCVGGNNDSACVDIHGEFYISNFRAHEINHFDVNGLWLETLPTSLSGGQKLAPYRVMVNNDNEVLMLCQDAIYRLQRTSQSPGGGFVWQSNTGIRFQPSQAYDVCFSSNMLYSIFKETLRVYRLDTPMDTN